MVYNKNQQEIAASQGTADVMRPSYDGIHEPRELATQPMVTMSWNI
jgi:hypothetical protein